MDIAGEVSSYETFESNVTLNVTKGRSTCEMCILFSRGQIATCTHRPTQSLSLSGKCFWENERIQSFFHSMFICTAQTTVRKSTSREALRCELVNQIKLLSIAF